MPSIWEQHYQAHGDALVLYARQFVSVKSDAEDIVHDAFLRVFAKRKNRRHPNPKALLFKSVRWTALDRIKGDQRRQKRENDAAAEVADLFSPTTVPFPGVEEDEFSAVISRLLSQLPPDQQEVMVLHLWGDLSFREIGEQLDISPNTAASRYRYGLDRLRGETDEILAVLPDQKTTLTIE